MFPLILTVLKKGLCEDRASLRFIPLVTRALPPVGRAEIAAGGDAGSSERKSVKARTSAKFALVAEQLPFIILGTFGT